MTVTLGRIAAGDYGQDLISNFNNNASTLESAITDIDTSLGTKVGSSNVVALRENNNALEYSLDGSEWKSADNTIWGNIDGLLNNQIDLRDALNAKAAKATVDNQQTQINNLGTDVGTLSGNVSTLSTNVGSLDTQVQGFATQIADMVTSGNIAYIRQVEEGGVKYFEWSADNINWVRSVVGDSAEWGNITGTLSNQTDLNNALNVIDNNISTVSGDLAITNSNLGTLGGTVNGIDTRLTTAEGSISTLQSDKADSSTLTSHINNTSNPHSVTKAQVGLGNVDNTADMNKPLSTPQRNELNSILDDKGYVKDAKNISDLWLGTEADYLVERDLNRDILYFITDNIDFDYTYFVGDIDTTDIEIDDLRVKYTTASSGGTTNVSLVFYNAGNNAITLTLSSGNVATDQGAYSYVPTIISVASEASNTVSLATGFPDTETIEGVSIDIKWK